MPGQPQPSGSQPSSEVPAGAKLQKALDAVELIHNTFSQRYHDLLVKKLDELRPLAIAHTMTLRDAGEVLVSRRPKLVYGRFTDGLAPLYDWGQIEADYTQIRPMPEFAEEFLEQVQLVQPKDGAVAAANHFLLTFSDGIVPHSDKRFNTLTKNRRHNAPEAHAPLMLFNFGARCRLNLTHPKDGTLLRQIEFASGDFIFMPGWVNPLVKHSVEKLSDGHRTSIVLRAVDSFWLSPCGNFYMKDGKRFNAKVPWHVKQPALSDELASRVLAERSAGML